MLERERRVAVNAIRLIPRVRTSAGPVDRRRDVPRRRDLNQHLHGSKLSRPRLDNLILVSSLINSTSPESLVWKLTPARAYVRRMPGERPRAVVRDAVPDR